MMARKRLQRSRQGKNIKTHRRTTIRTGIDIAAWRKGKRVEALSEFLRQTDGLRWTKPLFLVLLEELHIGDEFDGMIGPPEALPPKRWPQAVAFAIALRHSWRVDDLNELMTRLASS